MYLHQTYYLIIFIIIFLINNPLSFAQGDSNNSSPETSDIISKKEDDKPSKPLLKETVGWIERVKLEPSNIVLDAKLDTGADNCSLNAQNIKNFKRRGQNWVKFEIRNRKKETETIELPVHKQTRIKRVKGKSQIRPVVRLGLCLGEKYSEVDVNLADRSNFSYPLLVGRSFLSAHVILDPSRTYTTEPDCSSK